MTFPMLVDSNNNSYYNQYLKHKIDLPGYWNIKDKSLLLDVTGNGYRVSYKTGKTENEAALIRANCPIPISCGIFYFEITVISKGKDGYIGIGVCTSQMPTNRLPGWEKQSYGYHGDDGNLFKGSGSGKQYGPTFTTNDVVGCCVNLMQNTLFFTKNGVPLSEATNDLKGMTLYPCIGLRTPGESIEVNFGQRPFIFDIEQLIKEEKEKVLKSMKSQSNGEEEINSTQLVLDYLIHHGYFETIRSFAAVTGSSGQNLDSQLDDIKNRQKISDLLSRGDIDQVIQELNRLYPNFLQKRQDILFKLQCQKFIEMIKTAPIEDTMAFGQQELYKFSQISEDYETTLQEIFSLIAYTDPFKSPVSSLLSEQRRDPIINDLNCALLVHCNKPAIPVLEKLIRQCKVVIDESISNNASSFAGLLDLKEFIDSDSL
ncbi:hypothetical protein DLAC_02771 [Tieghemostelium lacteum]|uniref:Uncharacterized protein n=1 Tax=Tieghemostelium lacteum TaxID=361077 RepID=A0A152A3E1_TIELA|nr:hypothetical protein DLAC_02771 [Tieghemostelium lacteum]|eukprot:KYR00730.1 hypothetical protein DLAC_02771 [Tieghemostelium lacteum]